MTQDVWYASRFYDPKIISTTGLFSAVGTADVQTTSAPTASANTKYFVTLTVTLPYTKVDFDKSKQDKYMAAIAAAAGPSAANVESAAALAPSTSKPK